MIQVAAIVLGVEVTAMYVLGAIFLAAVVHRGTGWVRPSIVTVRRGRGCTGSPDAGTAGI